jgi:hypothetical protein
MASRQRCDQRLRKEMVNELMHDSANNKAYDSPLLNDEGREWYPALLMDAAQNFDEKQLAAALIKQDLVVLSEPVGAEGTEAQVDRVLVERFARQELNLLRARAVCVLAREDGKKYVEVYRAEELPNASLAVQNLLHAPVDALAMLAKLRKSRTLEEALGLPDGFRSGLGLRIPEDATA